jgi:putative flippase GtrA
VIIAAVVAVAWNYPMNRVFVFARKDQTASEANDPSGA